jgi:DNA-directed RNA polymerase specialized sigma24 family protein
MRKKTTPAAGAAADGQPTQLTLPGAPGLAPEQDAEAKVLARVESAKKIIRMHPEVSFEEAMLQLNPLPRAAYTLKESAKVLGISYISVFRLVQRGKLKCSTALPGRKLIPTREIEAFLKR